MTKRKNIDELYTLMNVGKATYKDLHVLGVYTIAELAKQDPDDLYIKLQTLTGIKQDPCVWDVFAAIIHEARTGEKQPWWHWTAIRKKRKI